MNKDDKVQAILDIAVADIKKLLSTEDVVDWDLDNNSWFVKGTGDVVTDSSLHYDYYVMGNAYPTKEKADQAISQRKAYMFIVREIARVNREGNWVADWSVKNQRKYFISINHDIHGNIMDWTLLRQTQPVELYGCRLAIQNIISNHMETWKLAMGIA